ncbi:hypothetical protein NDU88_000632 [Pleurodeles waltl]|uniref:Uncharacterized protein n=1 Tax=Pleurodeles waltl TaxID=8319 RepID=A0AAV7MSE5_PLEWA|nr:hypothetical protein NDU88_000632 [Pleurodeles waltl]
MTADPSAADLDNQGGLGGRQPPERSEVRRRSGTALCLCTPHSVSKLRSKEINENSNKTSISLRKVRPGRGRQVLIRRIREILLKSTVGVVIVEFLLLRRIRLEPVASSV